MSDEPPIPLDPNFRIELPNFEGPLDLLLFLIQKHELDILDLPISFITEKYLEYISLMQRLDLDVAAEYLVMAATLAHIKSKSLLPEPPKEQDDENEEELDPRGELIKRLLEYQKYKNAAESLGARGVFGRDVFTRVVVASEATGPAPLAPIGLFKLVEAFQQIAKRSQADISLEVTAERITIQERMEQVLDALRVHKRVSFEMLFEGFASTYDLVVTFLALLEMAKGRLVRVYQAAPESPIYVEASVQDPTQAPSVPHTITSDGEGSPLDLARESGEEGEPSGAPNDGDEEE